MTSLTARAQTISLFKKRRFLQSLSEADFRDRIVRPLFLRQGLQGGADVCGPNEMGRDAIFVATNSLGMRELYVVQTKKGALKMTRKATQNVVEATTQMRTALATPVHLLHEGKRVPDKAILCASGTINDSARTYVTTELTDPRVLFLDADELIPRLDEFFPELWFDIDASVTPYLRVLKKAMEDYSEDILPAVSGEADVPSSVADSRFVMLHATRTRLKTQRRSGKVERVPHIDEVPISGLVNRRERLIILTGEAGSGKSTSLRKIVCLLIDRYLTVGSKEQRIPIFVRAATLAAERGSALDIVADEIMNLSGTTQPVFAQADLLEGRVTLLIDAFDEVPADSDRIIVLDRLLEFNELYPRCQVILSSRDYSSITVLSQLEHFERFRLTPISLGQASQLLGHLEKARRLSTKQSQEILRRLKDVHGLTLNPLLVTVFAATTDGASRKDIPANITELFKKYTELMLGRWDASKGLAQQYHSPLKDYLLRNVAFELHRRRETSVSREEFREMVRTQISKLGHDLDLDVMVEELLDRSGLFRAVDATVEFRHRLLQEFFAGRGVPSLQVLQSYVAEDWWQRAIVFYFGEHPDNVNSLQSAVAAASEGSGGERFRAAITLGLALQACYLVDVAERMNVLRWVIEVLAESKDAFVEAACAEGGRPLIAFVWYYLFARDSVACTMPGTVRTRLEEAVSDGTLAVDERDTRRFWLIVGELETGNMAEAERLSKGFDPSDDRLALGIYLGAFLVQHLRVSTEADRKIAGRISRRFEGRLGGLRKQLYEEFKSEVLEVRDGDIAALPEAERSGGDGVEEGMGGSSEAGEG